MSNGQIVHQTDKLGNTSNHTKSLTENGAQMEGGAGGTDGASPKSWVSDKNDSVDKESLEDPGYGWRHIQLLLIFVAIFGQFSHRSCLSVAIVAMTKEITPGQDVFPWTLEEQGSVLGAFLWGYACTQIPAGYLTTRFGAKLLFGVSIMSSSVILMCTPFVAHHFGWIGVTVLRALAGLVQGVTFPGTYTLIGKWAVPQERSRATAFSSAALSGGTFMALALSGYMAVFLGWESIFYIFGCFSLIIGALWFIFVANSPDVHPWISDKERRYILNAIGRESKTIKGQTPWRAILTSVPFLCAMVANIGYIWGTYFVLTALPRYVNDIFHLPITLNGLVSGAPYLLALFVGFFGGLISDKLIASKTVSVPVLRRFFNTLGFWVPGLMLIALNFTPSSQSGAQIAELMIAVTLNGAVYSGYMVNYVELSPRFSGLIMAMGNCVACFASGIAPSIVGVFVTALGKADGWAASFYLTGGVLFVTNLIWITFASFEQQPWNDVEEVQRLKQSTQNSGQGEAGIDNRAVNDA